MYKLSLQALIHIGYVWCEGGRVERLKGYRCNIYSYGFFSLFMIGHDFDLAKEHSKSSYLKLFRNAYLHGWSAY